MLEHFIEPRGTTKGAMGQCRSISESLDRVADSFQEPVAVTIDKAIVEMPPCFAGRPPIGPLGSAGVSPASGFPRPSRIQ